MPLCYTLGEHAGGWAHCKLAQSLVCLLPPPNCVISWCFSVNGFYFNFKALPVLSCSAFFFCCFAWLCLWSRIGLGSKTVLEKETAFPDFSILHLSSQLPKGLLSWPAGSLRDGKHICFWANHEQPPHRHHDECIYIFSYFCDMTQSCGVKICLKM